MTCFFAKFCPCLFVIKSFLSFLTIEMAYLVVIRDVDPGFLLANFALGIRQRGLAKSSYSLYELRTKSSICNTNSKIVLYSRVDGEVMGHNYLFVYNLIR